MKIPKCRLAILLSGAGSTMVNIQKHIENEGLPAEMVVVVSSRKKVLGIDRAREAGVPTEILRRKPFRVNGQFDSNAYSHALAQLLAPYKPDLVVMAGFMTRLSAPLLDVYPTVNVHPALLPMFGGEGFYGHHVHDAVLEAGVKITGATVHFADDEYDHGPIICQEAVPVLDADTADTLAQRVQAAERKIYPQAIAAFAEGRLVRNGNKVKWKNS